MRLRRIKLEAQKRIDDKSAEVRRRFVSELPGQDGVYMDKLAEARAYLAELASNANAVPGPFISAEATRRGMSAEALAREVRAAGNDWTRGPRVQIEAERVGGKKDVQAAGDPEAVATALAASLAVLDAITP